MFRKNSPKARFEIETKMSSTTAANLFNVNGLVAVVTGGGSCPLHHFSKSPLHNLTSKQDAA
jgi:hypothetical protein